MCPLNDNCSCHEDEWSPPVRGDKYRWGKQQAVAMQVTVTRVARDGSWADIRCRAANGGEVRKRQRLPFPASFEKQR